MNPVLNLWAAESTSAVKQDLPVETSPVDTRPAYQKKRNWFLGVGQLCMFLALLTFGSGLAGPLVAIPVGFIGLIFTVGVLIWGSRHHATIFFDKQKYDRPTRYAAAFFLIVLISATVVIPTLVLLKR